MANKDNRPYFPQPWEDIPSLTDLEEIQAQNAARHQEWLAFCEEVLNQAHLFADYNEHE